jgi:Tfp pilus assembly protein PilV
MYPNGTGSTQAGVRGFSIVEVMVACFILAVVAIGITQIVGSAEGIRGRARALSSAEILASSEVERIRSAAQRHRPVTDSTYEEAVNGLSFTVCRTRLNRPSSSFEADTVTQEIAISVTRRPDNKPMVSLRLLQGYEQ